MFEHKKQSNSQKIGDFGEADFIKWATRKSINLAKPLTDYGFDFHGHLIEDNIVTGKMINVQCKSNEQNKKDKTFVLHRSDATLYLASNLPICIAGMDVVNEEIFAWIIDEELVNMLVKFLKTTNETITVHFSQLNHADIIAEKISEATKSSYMSYIKNLCLEQICGPNVYVESMNCGKSSRIIFHTNFLTNIVKPESLFGKDDNEKLEDIINISVLSALSELNISHDEFLITGEVGRTLEIGAKPGSPTTTVLMYPSEGNTCYRFKSGICIWIREVIKKKRKYSHKIEVTAEHSPYNIVSCYEDFYALEIIIASGELYIDGKDYSKILNAAKLLACYFEYMETVILAHEKGVISFEGVDLKSIETRGDFITIGVISKLITTDNMNSIIPGIYLTYTESDKDFHINHTIGDELKRAIIPMPFTIAGKSYIGNITCTFYFVYNSTNEIVGMQFDKREKFEVKEENSIGKYDYPELWTYKNWPSFSMTYEASHISEIKPDRKHSMIIID
ncbi:MAG: DUF4365 domain-containing protein [Fibrobacterales bacterium]